MCFNRGLKIEWWLKVLFLVFLGFGSGVGAVVCVDFGFLGCCCVK